MSFSGTPLGQGRRLDHHRFLGKTSSSNNSAVPASYASSAPPLGSRSPPKHTSSFRDTNTSANDISNDSGLAAYARIKQREQATIANRPGGPRTITTPPNPEKWSVKDTSVNIATAFTHAASSDMPSVNPTSNSWAMGVRPNPTVPRSTSVEYEMESQAALKRRSNAAASRPPPRTGAIRKPLSKTSSTHIVPDSEDEDSRRDRSQRATTPLDTFREAASRLSDKVTFYVRQLSQEPPNTSTEVTQPSINPPNSSYEYEEEERQYQASQHAQQSKIQNHMHKRNRMSEDNKAYKPSASDLEDSDEFSDDEGPKRRRGKKKKDVATGFLTTLPQMKPDKRRKKKRAKGDIADGAEGSTVIGEEDGSGSDEQVDESYAQPPISRRSRSLVSLPVQDSTNPDISMDLEGGLRPIPEEDEEDKVSQSTSNHARRAGSISPSSRRFSIGRFLGGFVNLFGRVIRTFVIFCAQILTLLTYGLGKILGTVVNVMLARPYSWLLHSRTGSSAFASIIRAIALGGCMVAIWYILQGPLPGYLSLPKWQRGAVYSAPDLPASNIDEFATRLMKMEKILSDMSVEAQKGKVKADHDAHTHTNLAQKLVALETRILSEYRRLADAETLLKNVANEELRAVRRDVEVLQAQFQNEQRQAPKAEGGSEDEEARVRLKALEDKLGAMEGTVKEAIDLGKKAGVSGTANTGRWSKLASGKTGLTIKSSDGQDVSTLIERLVDSAVSTFSKDTIARPDFALHSGGARIIPSLTSPTFEMRPTTMRGSLLSLITGNGYAIGRPPVTALHHELHNGHCWPFAGSEGQLGVALAAPVYISDVTIDHVAKEVAFDMRSAPRDMELWGMVEGHDNIAKVDDWLSQKAKRREERKERGEDVEDEEEYPKSLPKSPRYVRISKFQYNIHAPNHIQTFPVSQDIRDLGVDFGVVILLVQNNWGKDDYTCLYRLRVHGQKIGEAPTPLSEEQA